MKDAGCLTELQYRAGPSRIQIDEIRRQIYAGCLTELQYRVASGPLVMTHVGKVKNERWEEGER